MTAQQITAYYDHEWNTKSTLVLNRISGNRSAYAVRDDNGNWAPVAHRWNGSGLEFEPAACPPMCACDDLMDCPIPADNPARDWADTRTEGMGG